MRSHYTTARSEQYDVITFDHTGNAQRVTARMLHVTLQTTNPEYCVDRSLPRAKYEDYARILRRLDVAYGYGLTLDTSTIGNRDAMRKRIESVASNGWVLIAWSGTDCDGYAWQRATPMRSNNLRAIEREIDTEYQWFDGPASYGFDTPTQSDIDFALHCERVDLCATCVAPGTRRGVDS